MRSEHHEFDPEAVKARSIAEVVRLGGKALKNLPTIEATPPRVSEELAQRALVLSAALVGLAYEAPVDVIRDWIEANGLTLALSTKESALLRTEDGNFDRQTVIDLSWSSEATFALLWAGGLAPDLPVDGQPTREAMECLPKIWENESGQAFAGRVRLRPYAELYAMRDLYYRAHWYARDGQLGGYDSGVFDQSTIMERRKALEWLLDRTVDWDQVELDT